MQKIHRFSAGDKAASIGFFQIADNQFPGAGTVVRNHAANAVSRKQHLFRRIKLSI